MWGSVTDYQNTQTGNVCYCFSNRLLAVYCIDLPFCTEGVAYRCGLRVRTTGVAYGCRLQVWPIGVTYGCGLQVWLIGVAYRCGLRHISDIDIKIITIYTVYFWYEFGSLLCFSGTAKQGSKQQAGVTFTLKLTHEMAIKIFMEASVCKWCGVMSVREVNASYCIRSQYR